MIGTWIARFLKSHRLKTLARLAYALREPQRSAETFGQFSLRTCLDAGLTIGNEGHSRAWALGALFVAPRPRDAGTDGLLAMIRPRGSKAWWKFRPELHSHYALIAAGSALYVGMPSNSPAATRKTMVKLLGGSPRAGSPPSFCRRVPTSFHC
jgi:hypothetical protein